MDVLSPSQLRRQHLLWTLAHAELDTGFVRWRTYEHHRAASRKAGKVPLSETTWTRNLHLQLMFANVEESETLRMRIQECDKCEQSSRCWQCIHNIGRMIGGEQETQGKNQKTFTS